MIKVWMVFWSVGQDFQFKLYFQEPDAKKFMDLNKIKKSDNHKMMQIELHGDPDLFVCSHDDDNFRHLVFLDKSQAEQWLQFNDSGHMDVQKTLPGIVV